MWPAFPIRTAPCLLTDWRVLVIDGRRAVIKRAIIYIISSREPRQLLAIMTNNHPTTEQPALPDQEEQLKEDKFKEASFSPHNPPCNVRIKCTRCRRFFLYNKVRQSGWVSHVLKCIKIIQLPKKTWYAIKRLLSLQQICEFNLSNILW